MKYVKRSLPAILLFLFSFLSIHNGQSKSLHAQNLHDLQNLVGNQDAVIVADQYGKILFSKNADKMLIPASILKILTSLVAIHYLGPDYRFATEFYLDKDFNLKLKGYGDPLLISEVLADIAKLLSLKIKRVNDIVLDDTYFKQPIIIPGRSLSFQPYDAPNGALCANFNTVYFKRKDDSYVSAEPQTPFLPFILKRIKASPYNQDRIIFSHEKNDIVLYVGHLLRFFLDREGIKSSGKIRIGKVQEINDKLIYRYCSKFFLEQVISKMLEYSNNFMANQILIASGAKVYGPPGTIDKGVTAVLNYAKNVLKIEDIAIVEGSGISRKNKISAEAFLKILEEFEAYHHFMSHEDREFYKTGNLNGINTRAGYIENGKGELYRFVVIINTPGETTKPIMDKILEGIN